MDQRLSLITLTVDDVAEAARFFEEGLGWKRAAGEEEQITFYQIGGMGLAVYARTALEGELGHAVHSGTPGHSSIAWNGRTREEVDAAFEKAVAAGAKVIKQPHETYWGGYSCYLEILDSGAGGHMLELAYNPFWPIAKDGSVSLG